MNLHKPELIYFLNYDNLLNVYIVSIEDLLNLKQIVFVNNNQILLNTLSVNPINLEVMPSYLTILNKMINIKTINPSDYATLYLKMMEEYKHEPT